MLSRLWIGGASGADSGNYSCTVPALEHYSPDGSAMTIGDGVKTLFFLKKLKMKEICARFFSKIGGYPEEDCVVSQGQGAGARGGR